MRYLRIFLFSVAVTMLCRVNSHAQQNNPYTYSQTLTAVTDSFYIDSLPKTLYVRKKNLMKQQEGLLIIMSQLDDQNEVKKFAVKKYDLDRHELLQVWQCDIADSLSFYDFCLLPDNTLMLLTYQKICFLDLAQNKIKKTISHNASIRFVETLSSNKYLLYDIYPYHPFDGISKADLYVYDMKKGDFSTHKEIPLEGISLANAINHWLRVVNHKIYIVAPLTGKIMVYDSLLKETDHFVLPIPETNTKQNQEFVNYMDSMKSIANEELIRIRKEKGDEYIQTHDVSSAYYTKDALRLRLDSLQKHYTYIEKLFTSDNSTLIVTLSRPDYGMMMRDVYFVDLKTKKIKNKIIKWRTFAPKTDSVSRFEDFFTVPLPMAIMEEPFFYHNKVYAPTSYPVSLFKAGSVKDLEKAIFKWEKRNINTWSVLEFTVQ